MLSARLKIVVPSVITVILAAYGCGRPSEDAILRNDGGIPVTGVGGFGLQCPFGSINDPKAVKLQLWGCPLDLDTLTLTQPLKALYLSVDCKKKLMSIRMENRTMDSLWEVMPDGSFYMTVDGGVAHLASTGGNRGACSTPLTAVLMGKVDCTDLDKAKIRLETVWKMGQPAPAASPNPDAAPPPPDTCGLPKSCYLYSITKLNQCE